MKDLFDVQQLSQFEFGAIIITFLVAGLVFGCLLAYWMLKRKNSPNEQATAAIKEEFEEYKDKVDEHFNKTSEMFKDVTTQYKKLYDHMAVGAIELSKADTINMPRLEMQEEQVSESIEDDSLIKEPSSDSRVDSTKDETVEPVEETTEETTEETIEEMTEETTEATDETIDPVETLDTDESGEKKSTQSA